MKSNSPFHLSDFLWDAWCIASVVGIWPRFIEPNLLETSRLEIPIKQLPSQLAGMKILQFSDLHLHKGISDTFLNKLTKRISSLEPDLIVFSGDFLCYSNTDSEERLIRFLNTLNAPYGCYAVLGNHDYAESIAINDKGEYDVAQENGSLIQRGFSRLFKTPVLAKRTTLKALQVPVNKMLENILKKTPFKLLHNKTQVINVKGASLNLTGLGEYTVGRTLPETAFQGYQEKAPGIILLHNPDGVCLLKNHPGHLVLCGHTHGGQIFLPWMWKRFTLLENMDYVKGLKVAGDKFVYINRGVGSVMNFRWRAKPEILQVVLKDVS